MRIKSVRIPENKVMMVIIHFFKIEKNQKGSVFDVRILQNIIDFVLILVVDNYILESIKF